MQLAAAGLLALLCSQSSSVSQQVMESGGLAALQALLPEPPAPPLTAEQLAGFMGSSGGIMDAASTDGAKSPHKLATSKVCGEC